MKKIFIAFLISSIYLWPQQEAVKQLTNFDFESRNPSFIQKPAYQWEDNRFFFEGWNDTVSNIYSLKYNAPLDTFENLISITSNNFINRNPKAKQIYVPDYFRSFNYLLFETDESGNWDIAVSIDSGGGFNQPELLFDSPEDELNPSFLFESLYSELPLTIVFSRGNSVIFYVKDEEETEEIIFEGNDSAVYSNPAAGIWWDTIYVLAEKRINDDDPHIVFRKKHYQDTSWSSIIEFYSSAPAINPEVLPIDGLFGITFEKLFENKRKVLWMSSGIPLEIPDSFDELLDDPQLETSGFSSPLFNLPVLKSSEFYSSLPYSFRYIKNDSVFIRAGLFEYHFPYLYYIDFHTRVREAQSETGLAGVDKNIVLYTIWEDSSEGRINLFGFQITGPSTAVDDENILNDFVLLQNYPNPFNPVTKIKFITRKRSYINLSVYDILGRETAVLADEEKPSGEYEVEFNAAGLAGGVYFCWLRGGGFSSVKKMILLK